MTKNQKNKIDSNSGHILVERASEVETTDVSFEEYRRFEEFKAASDEQMLEIDRFVRVYSELVYHCVDRQPPKANVIHLDFNRSEMNAA